IRAGRCAEYFWKTCARPGRYCGASTPIFIQRLRCYVGVNYRPFSNDLPVTPIAPARFHAKISPLGLFSEIRLCGYGRVNNWSAHDPPFNHVGSGGLEWDEPLGLDQNLGRIDRAPPFSDAAGAVNEELV